MYRILRAYDTTHENADLSLTFICIYSGGVMGAANGTLTFMCGGQKEYQEEAKVNTYLPLLTNIAISILTMILLCCSHTWKRWVRI